jgi:hypothetical protein
MHVDLEILDLEINYLKETLYILLTRKELTSKDVVECSEKLDKLILAYENQMRLHKYII